MSGVSAVLRDSPQAPGWSPGAARERQGLLRAFLASLGR